MTKGKLVARLREQYPDLSIKLVTKIVDLLLANITEALEKGRRVELRGFGAFSLRIRKPRVFHDPRTNKEREYGERAVVYFKPSKELEKELNS